MKYKLDIKYLNYINTIRLTEAICSLIVPLDKASFNAKLVDGSFIFIKLKEEFKI